MCFSVNRQGLYFQRLTGTMQGPPGNVLRRNPHPKACFYAEAHENRPSGAAFYAEAHNPYARTHARIHSAMCLIVRTNASMTSSPLIRTRCGNQKASWTQASATGQGSTRQPPPAYMGFPYSGCG